MEKRVDKKAGEHWDGRLRVSSTYDAETFDMLDRLATACGISRTTLQTELVQLCLQNENIVNYIQDQHKHRARFRIVPSKADGKLRYIFAEKRAKGCDTAPL